MSDVDDAAGGAATRIGRVTVKQVPLPGLLVPGGSGPIPSLPGGV